MSLPEPLLSKYDIVVVPDRSHLSAIRIWNIWSEDPIKAAVIRAILACMVAESKSTFSWNMALALCQSWVCFTHSFHGSGGSVLLKRFQPYGSLVTESLLNILGKHPDTWGSPANNV